MDKELRELLDALKEASEIKIKKVNLNEEDMETMSKKAAIANAVMKTLGNDVEEMIKDDIFKDHGGPQRFAEFMAMICQLLDKGKIMLKRKEDK
jgi:hypothetical protein